MMRYSQVCDMPHKLSQLLSCLYRFSHLHRSQTTLMMTYDRKRDKQIYSFSQPPKLHKSFCFIYTCIHTTKIFGSAPRGGRAAARVRSRPVPRADFTSENRRTLNARADRPCPSGARVAHMSGGRRFCGMIANPLFTFRSSPSSLPPITPFLLLLSIQYTYLIMQNPKLYKPQYVCAM